ncbi:hypothetical protein BJ742DRAFT_157608 [Cladochytrium replicatum]|nr:hypothetical protein BJ742DRAFT_157608 [Cladochytrium replicatum]
MDTVCSIICTIFPSTRSRSCSRASHLLCSSGSFVQSKIHTKSNERSFSTSSLQFQSTHSTLFGMNLSLLSLFFKNKHQNPRERFFRSVAPGLSVTTPPALFFGGIFSSWIPLIDAIREHNTNAIDRNLMKTASYETSETVLRSSTIWSGSSGSARASLSRLSTTQPAVLITPSDRSWEVEEKRDDKARNTVSFSLKMVGLGKENKPLKSGVDGFYQTLSNPELYKSFREFATQDFTAECCSFYEHYTFLAEKISSSMLSQTPPQKITEQVHYASKRFALPPIPAPDTIKPNFLLMKKLFIDPGSDLELNIPSAMRAEILSTISGSNPIPMNVFDDTKNEVVYMLFSNTFEKWKAVQPRK